MPDEFPSPAIDLMRLYEAALREYHLNTTLGVQRQAFYIGLNVTLIGALASFKAVPDLLLIFAYLVGAAASLLGVSVVRTGHRYYSASREHFQAIERRLGLDAVGLALSTTPGMVGETGTRRMRITDAAARVLQLLALFDLASAGWIAWRLASQ